MPTKYASWTTYFNPMHFGSWIVTFFALVASAFILALPFYVRFNRFNGNTDDDHSNISWALFVMTSSLAQQGETEYSSYASILRFRFL